MKDRILYLCPFAHYSGHHPHVVIAEPRRFEEYGMKVDVLTTCGVLQPSDVPSPTIKYVRAMPVLPFLKYLRKYIVTRWLVMLVECVLTTIKAATLKYKLIYIRDGEPFLFVPLLLQYFTRKKLVISLTGSALAPPRIQWNVFRPHRWLYSIAARIFTSGISLYNPKRSRLVTQNELLRSKSFQCIPYGVEDDGVRANRTESREKLGLPQDKFIVLSFGVTHVGKSIDTIAHAIERVPGALMYHAGNLRTLGFVNVPKIDNIVVLDSYITDVMKPCVFGACDVMVLSYTKDFKSTASMLWEAAKYKVPVICSDSGTLGEITRKYDAGLVFEAENVDSLVNALNRFRAEKNLRLNGLSEIAKDFSVEKWATSYKRIFEELLNVNTRAN